ncbi:sec-independent protein translocase protein TatB [Parasphingorhabdus marina DSM 22363]|uniref:Sec-independent protein translocase protein TatB n=1 Tax=Parasphingorhabdus marina DSM 22363 TaxID=1123272 RepID=A0A1N6GVR7_9SPHN|nr:Sec-independent protein translocase protein TatB [Parasphingorhabdus marina]SIO11562.1 sec-independent protein translocase protein TatB [Parasphingorhabdus marina DSM 22363]
MFDLAFSEIAIIAIVAVVVIGPKELPRALATAGKWMGKARGVMNNFRTGLDAMVREAELQEMEKKWAAENDRIMREHPAGSDEEPKMEALDAPDHGDSAVVETAPPEDEPAASNSGDPNSDDAAKS